MLVTFNFTRFGTAVVKLEFGGESPLTTRAWKAGKFHYTIGPTRFDTVAVKLEFIGELLWCGSAHGFPLGGSWLAVRPD